MATAVTYLNTPTNLTAAADAGYPTSQIDLAWTDNTQNETGYIVQRSTDQINWTTPAGGSLGANAASFTDTSVAEGTTYYYYVYATGTGSNSANSATVSATTLPATPTIGTATANSASQITVTWTDNSSQETGYVVQRSPDGSTGWAQVGSTLAANTQSYADTSVAEGTQYYYRVYATGVGGNSANSGIVNATTVPATPTIGTATANSPTQITVTWTDNSSHESGYVVQRSPEGSTGWTQVGSTLAANTQSFTDTSVVEGTLYYYRVYATGAGGNSANSGTVNATTVPATPTIGTATANSATQITVAWTDNSSHETGYVVQRSPDGSTGWTQVGSTLAANTQSYVDTSVVEGTLNYYRVYATGAGGNSANSGTVSATTVPATPTIGTATANSATQITVTWTDNSSHETGYVVQRSADGSTGWAQVGSTLPPNTQSYADTSVFPSTAYYYRVYAVGAGGNSANSGTASATTPSNEVGGVQTDYWYGANNSAWSSQWSFVNQITNGGTPTLTIQNNQGQMQVPSVTSSTAGTEKCISQGNSWLDSDQAVSFEVNKTASIAGLIARSDSGGTTYYYANVTLGTSGSLLKINKCVSGSKTLLQSFSVGTFNTNTWYRLRFQVITNGSSTTLNAKVWAVGSTEPAWSTVSDSTAALQNLSGYCGMDLGPRASSSSTVTFTLDNYQAVNLTASNKSYEDDFQGDTVGNPASGWTVGAGTWSVASNNGSNTYKLSANPGGSGNTLGAIQHDQQPVVGGRLHLHLRRRGDDELGGNYAIVFGYQNSTNYYYMNFSTTANATALWKVVNGTATQIASYSGTLFSDTNYHAVKITADRDENLGLVRRPESAAGELHRQHVHRRPDRRGFADRHGLLRQRGGRLAFPLRPRNASSSSIVRPFGSACLVGSGRAPTGCAVSAAPAMTYGTRRGDR